MARIEIYEFEATSFATMMAGVTMGPSKNLIRTFCAGLALSALVFQLSAQAGIRCGNKLVTKGDEKFEVLQKCGNPAFREVVAIETVERSVNRFSKFKRNEEFVVDRFGRKFRKSDSITVEQPIEEWTYAQGKGRFLKILRFRGSKLIQIRTGARQ